MQTPVGLWGLSEGRQSRVLVNQDQTSQSVADMLKAFFGALWLLEMFADGGGVRSSSEALGLLQQAGLSGQRHKGRGQTPKPHPRAKAEVRGGQQRLEDAHEAEGRATVGDEVDLVAVGTQERRNFLQRFGPGNIRQMHQD